jgi:hypothetical protein
LKKLAQSYPLRQLLLICLIISGVLPEAFTQQYFQQEVNYTIHVALNDKLHELNAFETIEYINNSPDTLQFLYFHLWPNGYSDNNTQLARQLISTNGKGKLFNDPELRGFIDSLDFKIDGQKVQWDLLPGQTDICKILLNNSIKKGDTIQITTPFHVKIPKGVISRLGHIGESYQISQWYPKPAVYDRTGWHQMSYLDQGEFYSEFGRFDVSITLPSNYIVGATGNLQNNQEAEMLDKLAADTSWKSNLKNDVKDDYPPSLEQLKTLRYTGDQIHDFAWFADKRFHVLKGTVKLPDSGNEITTWVMFSNNQAELWKNALHYVNNSIFYFSSLIGDYPYKSFTVVQSSLTVGSGMEYPGVALVGLTNDAYSLDEVIAHEVSHNWFYSALGSNERRYPYLDEGLASAYEQRYMNKQYPKKKLWEVYYNNRNLARFFQIEKMPVQRMLEIERLIQARNNLEQPINLAATDFTNSNYGIILYNKTAQGFTYLRTYLGDSLFDAAMHDYYLTWKSKHPQPDDLQKAFESRTNKNLSWFFCDYLGTTKRLDYKVIRYKPQKLLVENRGELVSPLILYGMDGDSTRFTKWVDGFGGYKWVEIPRGNYSEIKIDSAHVMPETYRLNNNIRTSGIFRKTDPFQLQLLFTIEDPDKRILMFIPAVDWNSENGIMPGMILQNKYFLPKKIDYVIMPFYSFKKSGIAGYGRVSYNITPYSAFIRMATISLEGTQYGAPGNQDYHKIKAGVDLYFSTPQMNKPLNQTVFGYYYFASDLMQIELLRKAKMRSYLQLGYALKKNSIINPFDLLASIESHKSYQKASVEFNYRYSYSGKKSGLDMRLFAGTMLKTDAGAPFYSFAAGGRTGRELYLFQGYYPDRFGIFPNTFWSKQITVLEGGLVSIENDSVGYSRNLVSFSFTSNLPGRTGRIPVKPFVNMVLCDNGTGPLYKSSFYYEAGIKAGIWNFFEIYIPLLVSKNIETINSTFSNRIRIVLTLESMTQLKLNTRIK